MKLIISSSNSENCAYVKDNAIVIYVDKNLSIPTKFICCMVMHVHELTHLSRKGICKTKHFAIPFGDMSGYFLHPEEMIAFYNSIVIDSYARRTAFYKTLEYYINNLIMNKTSSINVINRFRNGMLTLHRKYKTLMYNKNMTKDNIKEAINRVEEEFNTYMYSICKHAIMSVAPEHRDEYVREQMIRIEELKRQTIQRIEEDYGVTADVVLGNKPE